jgi:hypothetical protein
MTARMRIREPYRGQLKRSNANTRAIKSAHIYRPRIPEFLFCSGGGVGAGLKDIGTGIVSG